MSKIKYVKGSLFDAPKETILVHACNNRGVWGSGIAAEFKKRFPDAYEEYRKACLMYETGETIMAGENIACLITSDNYGEQIDPKNEILVNTTLALNDFVKRMTGFNDVPIASNKFNSGLFKVPWNETEAILEVFVKRYGLDWTVYVQD